MPNLEWTSFHVGDRVTNVSNTGQPPFGYKGYVVGIYNEGIDVLYDQTFEGGSTLGGACKEARGMCMPFKFLLNTTKRIHKNIPMDAEDSQLMKAVSS